jgi:hypothetical protein
MSGLETERTAMEAYVLSTWIDTEVGLVDQPFTPPFGVDGKPVPSLRLSIVNGDRKQATIGGERNRVNTIGVLQIQLMTDAAQGRASWATYADILLGMFDRTTLDETGCDILTTGAAAFIRFSPPELGDNAEPYVAGNKDDGPFRVVTINAPFVRYDLR